MLTVSTFAQTDNDTLSIYFASNSSYLSKESTEKLTIFKETIIHEGLNLKELKGYCDTLGSTTYNLYLSNKRVKTVLKILSITNESSIKWSGNGEVHPAHTRNYSNSEKRRVDIIYSKADEISEKVKKVKKTEPSEVPLNQNENSLTSNFINFLKDTTLNEVTIQLSILFQPGTDAFLHPNDPQLVELYNFLHYNSNISAHIRGHVCCGNNLPLSHNRAMRVYNYLVHRSISPKRVDYQGYSNKLPVITPEKTKEDRQKNRRVDVIFSKHFTQ